jgi:cardiolipin synthase
VEAPQPGTAEAAFVTRDNRRHRDDIERVYRTAIRAARSDVIIANAYFFPGWRLLRDMVRASRRGVRVQLILQGQPDMAYVRTAARLLYPSLAKDGVQIFEYCRRPLHGKVAVIDGQWCTVGSSNLDPLSLSLNLEANVVVNDRDFAADLRERLLRLESEHCRLIRLDKLPRRTGWRYLLSTLGYHVARRFPAWLQRLPRGVPRIRSFDAERGVQTVPLHDPGDPEPR